MERGESSEGGGTGEGDERGWLEEWKVHTRSLRSALQSGAPDEEMKRLLSDCFSRYSNFLSLRASRRSSSSFRTAERRSPIVGTSLEAAFTWLGGWRPSCAVVMISSLLKTEAGVVSAAVTSDRSTCYLTKEQLTLLESLQREIRQFELEFSNQLSVLQMLVADQSMLSALTICSGPSSGRQAVKEIMDSKVAALNGLLEQADKLRLHTLEELFKLLTPVQAAQASVAAFEIVFMMRSMGSNSTLMRSMSASEATFEQAIILDMMPTVQNVIVPIHANLTLENSVTPVTLSFPIVPATVMTAAVVIQSSPSTFPVVTPNFEGPGLQLGPELPEPALVDPNIGPPTAADRTTQAASARQRETLVSPVDLDDMPSTSHTEKAPPLMRSKDVGLPPAKRSFSDSD